MSSPRSINIPGKSSMIPSFTAATVVLLVVVSSCTTIPDPPTIPTDPGSFASLVDQRAAHVLKRRKIQGGLSLGVYSRGDTLLARGYGYADQARGQRITDETPMPVGSVSKTFTALGVMQLVEDGIVGLADPLSLHLPTLSLPDGAENRITVGMLLTHRSGIQGDVLVDFVTRDNVDASEYQRRTLDILADRPLLYEPGKLYSYSNAGFALLGILIEEKSGVSYADYVRTRIFEPAGMEDSLVYPGERATEIPLGYGMGEPSIPARIRDMAAGSLLISSRDMMKFVDALFTGRIVTEATWNEMVRPQNRGNPYDRSFSIGLGYWLINPLETEDLMAAHGGDIPPYQALLVILPDRKSAVFAAANDMSTGAPLAMPTGTEILKDLLQYEEGVSLETLQTTRPTSPGYSGDVASLAGLYNTVAGPIAVVERNGRLSMRIMGMNLHLNQDDHGWWKPHLRILGIPVRIGALDALSVDLFTVDGDSWIGLWSGGIYGGSYRMIDDPGKPEEFAVRTGTWRTVDPGQVVQEIRIRSGRDFYLLSFDFLGNKLSFVLQPEGADFATVAGEGRFVGDRLVFRREGDLDFVEYSGMVLQKTR